MPKKYLEPKVFLTCHFCGEHLKYEVTVDTYKIWQAKVHNCGRCKETWRGVKDDRLAPGRPSHDILTEVDDYECDKCKSPIFKKTPQGGWAGEI